MRAGLGKFGKSDELASLANDISAIDFDDFKGSDDDKKQEFYVMAQSLSNFTLTFCHQLTPNNKKST